MCITSSRRELLAVLAMRANNNTGIYNAHVVRRNENEATAGIRNWKFGPFSRVCSLLDSCEVRRN